MRFGAAVVSGISSILIVVFAVQLFPWMSFAWLDEAIFVGFLVTGHVALAPVVGALPLIVVGGGTALLAWRWANGRIGRAAFASGFWTAIILYALGVAISNPFIGMFHGYFGGPLPETIQGMMSTPGWVSIVESLWGHILYGLVLGTTLWLGTRGDELKPSGEPARA